MNEIALWDVRRCGGQTLGRHFLLFADVCLSPVGVLFFVFGRNNLLALQRITENIK